MAFLALFALRAFTMSQRRRGRGRGRPMSGPMARSQFTGVTRRDPTSSQTVRAPDVAGPPGPGGLAGGGTAPGWFVDPFFKHQQRYWSGTGWTEHVTDDGKPGTDPPPSSPG